MAVLETVRKAMADGAVDFLCEALRIPVQGVMDAEVTELTGVLKGERAPGRRLTSRNGYRERRWDTRVARSNSPCPASATAAPGEVTIRSSCARESGKARRPLGSP